MNKRKLQHFKLAILLFGICVLFTNCQKESIEVTAESQLDPRVKHITFAAFKSKTASSENYQKLNSFFDFNKTQVLSEYNRLESSDGAWIITDEIVMIEREDKLFYTFKIGTVTSSDSFYNLLVITDVTGEIIDSKIFEYIPSSAWLEDTSQPFTGYMKLNDDDIFSISDLNGMLSRGGQLCITGTRDNWMCSEGNNHDGPAPGRTCTWWENTITAIYGQCPPVLTPGDLDEGVPVGQGSSGGGGGGPGASTGTTNNDCVPAIDNPCDEDETVIMIPNQNNCKNTIPGLSQIVNTPTIKAELHRLKFNMGFSAVEDGKRFIYTGANPNDPSTYNEANFQEQLSIDADGNSIDFPPLQNNTLVGAHYHPDLTINALPVRKVPSGLDIAEHINMIKKMYATNPIAASQVTNFIVSKGNNGRTYILRANNVQNIVNNTKDYTKRKHREDLLVKVHKLLINNYDTMDFDGHETAIANYLSEKFPGLDLYKAEYDANGNITKFCKL